MPHFTLLNFQGEDFFERVKREDQWIRQKHSFWGKDERYDFNYVVMDATFYQFKIYDRFSPHGQLNSDDFSDLTESLMEEEQNIRAMTNGQLFNWNGDNNPWGGQIANSTYSAYDPLPSHEKENSYTVWYTFGQYLGRSHLAYDVLRGRPTNMEFYNAFGGLGWLVQNGVKAPDVGKLAEPSDYTNRFDNEKVIVGIHRDSNCIFVLAEDNNDEDFSFSSLKLLLADEMGVDDAVILDGATSVALLVGGTDNEGTHYVEKVIEPSYIKEDDIPNGTIFEYNDIVFLEQESSISINRELSQGNPESIDESFFQAFYTEERIYGITGVLKPRSSSRGVELTFNSWGSLESSVLPDGRRRVVHEVLGLSMPLNLFSDTHNVVEVSTFNAPRIQGSFRLDARSDDHAPNIMRGSLAVVLITGDLLVLDFFLRFS